MRFFIHSITVRSIVGLVASCSLLLSCAFGQGTSGQDDNGDTNTVPPPPFVDTDGDGLSDHDETYIWGTDPNVKDSDGDGLDDGVDLLAHDAALAMPRLATPNYALIDLGEVVNLNFYDLEPQYTVNDKGTVMVSTDAEAIVFSNFSATPVSVPDPELSSDEVKPYHPFSFGDYEGPDYVVRSYKLSNGNEVAIVSTFAEADFGVYFGSDLYYFDELHLWGVGDAGASKVEVAYDYMFSPLEIEDEFGISEERKSIWVDEILDDGSLVGEVSLYRNGDGYDIDENVLQYSYSKCFAYDGSQVTDLGFNDIIITFSFLDWEVEGEFLWDSLNYNVENAAALYRVISYPRRLGMSSDGGHVITSISEFQTSIPFVSGQNTKYYLNGIFLAADLGDKNLSITRGDPMIVSPGGDAAFAIYAGGRAIPFTATRDPLSNVPVSLKFADNGLAITDSSAVWVNGKSYLPGDLLSNNEDYSNFELNDISDNGSFIVSTAIYTPPEGGPPEERVVLLLSAAITGTHNEPIEVLADDHSSTIYIAPYYQHIDSNGEAEWRAFEDGTVVDWKISEGQGGVLSAQNSEVTDGVAKITLTTPTVPDETTEYKIEATVTLAKMMDQDEEEISINGFDLRYVTESITLVPGKAASIEVQPSVDSLPADLESQAELTITARDQFGNLIADDTPLLALLGEGQKGLLVEFSPDENGLLPDSPVSTDGVFTLNYQAGRQSGDQGINILIDDFEETYAYPVETISVGLSASSPTLELYSNDVVTITANFSTNADGGNSAIEGTPIDWHVVNARIVSADYNISSGQAQVTIASQGTNVTHQPHGMSYPVQDNVRTGKAYVSVYTPSSQAVTSINVFSDPNNKPLHVMIDNPVMVNSDGFSQTTVTELGASYSFVDESGTDSAEVYGTNGIENLNVDYSSSTEVEVFGDNQYDLKIQLGGAEIVIEGNGVVVTAASASAATTSVASTSLAWGEPLMATASASEPFSYYNDMGDYIIVFQDDPRDNWKSSGVVRFKVFPVSPDLTAQDLRTIRTEISIALIDEQQQAQKTFRYKLFWWSRTANKAGHAAFEGLKAAVTGEVTSSEQAALDFTLSIIPFVGDGRDMIVQGVKFAMGNQDASSYYIVTFAALGLVADLGGPNPFNLLFAGGKIFVKFVGDAGITVIRYFGDKAIVIGKTLRDQGEAGVAEATKKFDEIKNFFRSCVCGLPEVGALLSDFNAFGYRTDRLLAYHGSEVSYLMLYILAQSCPSVVELKALAPNLGKMGDDGLGFVSKACTRLSEDARMALINKLDDIVENQALGPVVAEKTANVLSKLDNIDADDIAKWITENDGAAIEGLARIFASSTRKLDPSEIAKVLQNDLLFPALYKNEDLLLDCKKLLDHNPNLEGFSAVIGRAASFNGSTPDHGAVLEIFMASKFLDGGETLITLGKDSLESLKIDFVTNKSVVQVTENLSAMSKKYERVLNRKPAGEIDRRIALERIFKMMIAGEPGKDRYMLVFTKGEQKYLDELRGWASDIAEDLEITIVIPDFYSGFN